MKRADKVLNAAIDIPEVLRAARAKMALAHWDDVVGPLLAARSHPDRYDRGTLFVAVEGSAWANELRMKRDLICARLNAAAQEKDLFQEVRFGVRKVVKPPVAAITDSEPPCDYGAMTIREIAERRRRMNDESGAD
ncbi:MAG: DUF721 domain-containing protein [Fimbriimonadaceae bacterium]